MNIPPDHFFPLFFSLHNTDAASPFFPAADVAFGHRTAVERAANLSPTRPPPSWPPLSPADTEKAVPLCALPMRFYCCMHRSAVDLIDPSLLCTAAETSRSCHIGRALALGTTARLQSPPPSNCHATFANLSQTIPDPSCTQHHPPARRSPHPHWLQPAPPFSSEPPLPPTSSPV